MQIFVKTLTGKTITLVRRNGYLTGNFGKIFHEGEDHQYRHAIGWTARGILAGVIQAPVVQKIRTEGSV